MRLGDGTVSFLPCQGSLPPGMLRHTCTIGHWSCGLPALKSLIHQLPPTLQEAQALAQCITQLGASLPDKAARQMSDWAMELLSGQSAPEVTHPGVVRALLGMHVTLRRGGCGWVPCLQYVQYVHGRACSTCSTC